MSFAWLILGAVGVVLLLALLVIVSRMAREREAARRRRQAAMRPLAEDTTITYAGHS
jgi:flagellar basal body-associated protein FliL